MDYQTLLVSREEGVTTVTLNRPERLNAFNTLMRQEITRIAEELKDDEETRVIVITGAGRAFCAGGDVREMANRTGAPPAGDPRDNFRQGGMRAVLALREIDKPIIAAVNGPAAGGGMGLALCCDIRIASENATFGQVFVKRGLVPDWGASWFLPRLVGTSKACELIWTGEMIDANEAERLGIVSRVVPADDLLKVSKELAAKIAKGAPLAIRMSKLAIFKGLQMDLATELEFEAYGQAVCMRTEDHREGVKAFLEKREPVFKGR